MTNRIRLVLGLSGLMAAAAFASSAMASKAPKSRVFEMRTYVALPGRLDALNKRFRDHTTALFEKHGMVNIGYWVPQDEKDGKENTLVYLLAHSSRDAAKASWAAFQADPEWVKARDASEKDGKIVAKVTSVFLDPTDYSAIK
ncbi:MAG: hypothetical protein JWN86_3174 [Planctomycetota bacterium]|nr:hypothetical protein [Planctomycetota bacterium]